ncbi:MAG: asparagine synthase-related protein [Caldilineaceae bacterium]
MNPLAIHRLRDHGTLSSGGGLCPVFLSGDGGDEAFGGSRRYVGRLSWLLRVPRPVAHGVQLLAQPLSRHSSLRFQLAKSMQPEGRFAAAFDDPPTDPVLATLLNRRQERGQAVNGERGVRTAIWQRWAQAGNNEDALLARQQRLDYALYLPDDILVKMDRAAMAHSIEVRSPFLDYRLVEWAARLPRGVLVADGVGKVPLRQLGQRLLPPAVQRAGKRGFGVPLDSWFRTPQGLDFARSRLLSTEAKARGLWNTAGADALLRAHQANQGRNFGAWIWRLLMLDAWARHYVDSDKFASNDRFESN